jgi:hypothetical protein
MGNVKGCGVISSVLGSLDIVFSYSTSCNTRAFSSGVVATCSPDLVLIARDLGNTFIRLAGSNFSGEPIKSLLLARVSLWPCSVSS